MTAADFLRFVIIAGLGVIAFITFLVSGTIVVLMWLDSFRCGTCSPHPAGMYVLAAMGVLLIASAAMGAGEAPGNWRAWIEANRDTVIIGAVSFVALLVVMNSRWWFF
jgi:hypothetical protein